MSIICALIITSHKGTTKSGLVILLLNFFSWHIRTISVYERNRVCDICPFQIRTYVTITLKEVAFLQLQWQVNNLYARNSSADTYLAYDASMSPYSASGVLLTSVPSMARTIFRILSLLDLRTSSLVTNPFSFPPSRSNICEN